MLPGLLFTVASGNSARMHFTKLVATPLSMAVVGVCGLLRVAAKLLHQVEVGSVAVNLTTSSLASSCTCTYCRLVFLLEI